MSVLTATDADHSVLTTACGIVDRSERGKLALTGADRRSFLGGQVTNDVEALEAGHGLYAAFLTHKGKMLGDVRILETGEALLLDTERVSLQALFDLVRRFSIGYDVQLHKRTLQTGLLSLIGPQADAVLVAVGAEAPGVDEHENVATTIGGSVSVRAARTSLGVDLLCAADDGAAVLEALHEAGAHDVPLAAAEVLRVEAGVPRYGVDLDDTVIPQEAGLNERAVSFTKGCYVGQETVARLFYKGKPNRHLRGLLLSGAAEPGAALVLREGDADGREVGRLGSVALSPAHGPIALAIVRREAQPGATAAVGTDGVTATVTELPFTPPGAAAPAADA